MTDPRRPGALLLAAVTSALDDVPLPPQVRRDLEDGETATAVTWIAHHHGVAAALHVALQGGPALPDDLSEPIRSAYHAGVRAHLRAIQGLALIDEVLDGVAPWLVVKGPVVAGLFYRRPDLRTYVDLDVLVPPDRFPHAVEALEQAGCVVADRNWDLLLRRQPGELRVQLPSGLWVDLHWHLVNDPALRRRVPLDGAALWGAARQVTLGGVTVSTLGRAHTLVHLALHACLGGADRLSWAVDLREAIRADHPPWDDVVRVAAANGVALPVGVMLRRADRSLALDVPPAVLDELTGRAGWVVLTRLIDRWRPIERSTGRPSLARIVLRATRADARQSTAELLRRSVRWGAGGARRTRRTVELDPDDDASFLHPAGGAEGRAAYMRLVAAHG